VCDMMPLLDYAARAGEIADLFGGHFQEIVGS
jgi:hypothetical protein